MITKLQCYTFKILKWAIPGRSFQYVAYIQTSVSILYDLKRSRPDRARECVVSGGVVHDY
jgi:hypothetical protein